MDKVRYNHLWEEFWRRGMTLKGWLHVVRQEYQMVQFYYQNKIWEEKKRLILNDGRTN